MDTTKKTLDRRDAEKHNRRSLLSLAATQRARQLVTDVLQSEGATIKARLRAVMDQRAWRVFRSVEAAAATFYRALERLRQEGDPLWHEFRSMKLSEFHHRKTTRRAAATQRRRGNLPRRAAREAARAELLEKLAALILATPGRSHKERVAALLRNPTEEARDVLRQFRARTPRALVAMVSEHMATHGLKRFQEWLEAEDLWYERRNRAATRAEELVRRVSAAPGATLREKIGNLLENDEWIRSEFRNPATIKVAYYRYAQTLRTKAAEHQ